MSSAPDPFLETALALPQSQRADLAFQLLQSLDPPGEEISAEQFGVGLRERVESARSGDIESRSLDAVRAIVEKRLAEGRPQ